MIHGDINDVFVSCTIITHSGFPAPLFVVGSTCGCSWRPQQPQVLLLCTQTIPSTSTAPIKHTHLPATVNTALIDPQRLKHSGQQQSFHDRKS